MADKGIANASSDSDYDSGSLEEEDVSWIQWFCSLRGNEFFCEVDESFIQDNFNLTGLSEQVPYYLYGLDMLLDVQSPYEEKWTEEQQEIVETQAEKLYGLIHSRFIVTTRGLDAMNEKFQSVAFGRCPRYHCEGQPVLPVGLSDSAQLHSVRIFCPRCEEIYYPKSARHARIDGAYFGTTFAHLLCMMFPDSVPNRTSSPRLYCPRIFGFKLHPSSAIYRGSESFTGDEQARLAIKSKAQAEASAGTRDGAANGGNEEKVSKEVSPTSMI